ncbi:MAG: DUF805 domain-containing protein [Clostridia bacterium]|nr:DUF805 domain-containing protein [Clostridia bacterium]
MKELFEKNFIEVLKTKYAEFNGRETRRNYWMFVLCVVIINIALGILAGIFANNFLGNFFYSISGLFSLAILVPSLGMSVRRLHDIGKDWVWILVVLIPLVGQIWLIIMLAQEPQKSDNQYGPYVA